MKRKALVNVTKVTVLYNTCIWHHLLLFLNYSWGITLAIPNVGNGYIDVKVHEFILYWVVDFSIFLRNRVITFLRDWIKAKNFIKFKVQGRKELLTIISGSWIWVSYVKEQMCEHTIMRPLKPLRIFTFKAVKLGWLILNRISLGSFTAVVWLHCVVGPSTQLQTFANGKQSFGLSLSSPTLLSNSLTYPISACEYSLHFQ